MVGCLLLGRERAISSCCQLMLPWVFPYPIGNIWQMVADEIKSSYPSALRMRWRMWSLAFCSLVDVETMTCGHAVSGISLIM